MKIKEEEKKKIIKTLRETQHLQGHKTNVWDGAHSESVTDTAVR